MMKAVEEICEEDRPVFEAPESERNGLSSRARKLMEEICREDAAVLDALSKK
jgi:hypothetical protein